MKKLDIIPTGTLCSYDPFNSSNQHDYEVSHVIVVGHKIKRQSLFKSQIIYEVIKGDDPFAESFEVSDKMLAPLNVMCIRYPSTLPVIGSLDIDAVFDIKCLLEDKYIDSLIKNHISEMNADQSTRDVYLKKYKAAKERLVALYTKLKFYDNMKDV